MLMVTSDFSRVPAEALPSAGEVWVAQGFADRLLGVFATSFDRPVMLRDCNRVHGIGLSRPLYLTFLNSDDRVINSGVLLRPWSIVANARAKHVLESFTRLVFPIGCRLRLCDLEN